MHQKDYILRLIEQAGAMLIALRNLILGRGASRREIEEHFRAASRVAGLDLQLARLATPDTLALMVAPTGEVEPGRCWLLAELLYLDGLHAQLEERAADARTSYEKAERLFSLLEPGGALLVGFPEAAERIAEIRGRLSALRAAGA